MKLLIIFIIALPNFSIHLFIDVKTHYPTSTFAIHPYNNQSTRSWFQ